MSDNQLSNNGNPWDSFLSPESMLTPGIAGAIVAFVTPPLARAFVVVAPFSSQIALLLSALLALVVAIRVDRHIYLRIIYFLFNTLIVFAIASSPLVGKAIPAAPSSPSTDGSMLFPTAFAQPPAKDVNQAPAPAAQSSPESSWVPPDRPPAPLNTFANPFFGPQSIFSCPFGSCGFTAQQDTDYPGHDLTRTAADSLSDCQELCRQDGKCGAYTYFPRGVHPPQWKGPPPPICFLKSSPGYPVVYSGMISGVKLK